MNNVSQGPPQPPRECTHDSTRVDGWLDNCCLRCGLGGYWKGGYSVAEATVHPSGKVLVKVAGNDG